MVAARLDVGGDALTLTSHRTSYRRMYRRGEHGADGRMGETLLFLHLSLVFSNSIYKLVHVNVLCDVPGRE